MKKFTARMPDTMRQGIEIAADLFGQEPSVLVRAAINTMLGEIAEHQHDPEFYRNMVSKIRAARVNDSAA